MSPTGLNTLAPMLFTPEAHEALVDEPWSTERARTAIASIAADAESAFDDGWPMHPQDVVEDGDASTRFRNVYDGGAGVVEAFHRLAQRGFVELRRDYVPYLERSLEVQPDFPDDDTERSLWNGETGIRLVLQRLAPTQANLERLSELIAANERDERCDLMWGSPGTILTGRELGLDVTASIEWLQGQRDTDGLWTQQIHGRTSRCLGPAHGFAGCVLALGDVAGVSETLERFAVEEDGLVNWLPYAEMRQLDGHRDGQIRTQWCHGAPGIVATLAYLLDEEAAVAGGELTWRAGPLRKGAGLCHGTAGNGYAFLALLERTGDERWLERARTFAMHAAGQVEHSRSDQGRGRYTLWTGDLGTALYLADCTDGGGRTAPPVGRARACARPGDQSARNASRRPASSSSSRSYRARQRRERLEHDAPVLDAPDARDEPVDEERLRDVAVHADDRLPVLLRKHARPVREREQHVVPLRQEANGRGRLGVRQRRARDVEELAAVLVAEAAQRLEPVERALELGHVHHAPGDDVTARRGPERGEVATEDLGARLGRVVRLRLLDRDEAARGRARSRAPSRGGAGRARARARRCQARRASMPVSPCSRSRCASASAVVTGPPPRALAPTARGASPGTTPTGSSSRSSPPGGASSHGG